MQHWGVERNLHWQLDVTFGEDKSKKHVRNSAENYSRLLRFVLQLVKNTPIPTGISKTASIKIRACAIALRDNLLKDLLSNYFKIESSL